jgi:hypothetical protein
MSDLDFDELHQEVSKLMDQANKPKAKKTQNKTADKAEPAKVMPKEATVIAREISPASEPAEEDTRIAVRRPVAQIIPKRKGVAMDIVQPKPNVPAPPSARASRTAPTLHPTGPVAPEPPSPRETTVAPTPPKSDDVSDDTLASLNLQKDSARPANDPPEHNVTSTFPDPLDVHGFTGDEDKAAGDPPASAPAPTMQHTTVIQPTGDKASSAAAAGSAPETNGTPFVNAKVEKRPLGAFAATGSTDQQPAEGSAEAANVPAKEEKAADAASVQPAPKELNPELVAVESSEPEFTPGTPGAPEPSTTVNDLRQMSIPQQYKAADAEPSREDRPIFDTKTYHPPIAPVAKAHKGGGSRAGMLLTLILILLIIIAGVGAYFVATGAIDVNSLIKQF